MNSTDLSLISKAIDLANQIRGVADKARDPEIKLLTADLQLALANVKMQIVDLINESLSLKQQLADRDSAPHPGSELEFKDGAYWYTTPPPGRSPGPYCPRCKEVEDRMVTLSKPDGPFLGLFKWQCPQCDKTFN